jgi:hypothetical protein
MTTNRCPGPDERPGPHPDQRSDANPFGAGPPAPPGLPPADRPSIQVAMAASMLRRGHDPMRVADVTQVPLALIELLVVDVPAEHPTDNRSGNQASRPAPSADRPRARPRPYLPRPAPGPSPRDMQTSRPWAKPRRGHVPAGSYQRWPLIAILPMVMNLGLALAAVASHRPVLAAVSLLIAAPVFVLSVLAALR